jgi:broad specificity phosphatase PhoE
MPDVVLIRPGCTDFDEHNRIQGVLDLPLNHRGQAQVLSLIARLQDVSLDVVYTAPSEPARSTAQAICEQCGSSLKEVDDFRNLNHGLWQGLQVDDVRRKYPKVFKQWQESPETVRLPEGETVAEAVERIRHGLRKCLKRKRTIGIVASEPLATMIGCVLRGDRPGLPATVDRKCTPTIERISLSSTELPEPRTETAALVNGHAKPTDAAARNGKAPTNGNGSSQAPIIAPSVTTPDSASARSRKDTKKGITPFTKRGAAE